MACRGVFLLALLVSALASEPFPQAKGLRSHSAKEIRRAPPTNYHDKDRDDNSGAPHAKAFRKADQRTQTRAGATSPPSRTLSQTMRSPMRPMIMPGMIPMMTPYGPVMASPSMMMATGHSPMHSGVGNSMPVQQQVQVGRMHGVPMRGAIPPQQMAILPMHGMMPATGAQMKQPAAGMIPMVPMIPMPMMPLPMQPIPASSNSSAPVTMGLPTMPTITPLPGMPTLPPLTMPPSFQRLMGITTTRKPEPVSEKREADDGERRPSSSSESRRRSPSDHLRSVSDRLPKFVRSSDDDLVQPEANADWIVPF